MAVWRMRIACWISKVTKTYSEYVIFIDFPLQQWLHDCASLLHYTYVVSLVTVWTITILFVAIRRITVVGFVASSNTRSHERHACCSSPLVFVCCSISWTQALTIGRHWCPSREFVLGVILFTHLMLVDRKSCPHWLTRRTDTALFRVGLSEFSLGNVVEGEDDMSRDSLFPFTPVTLFIISGLCRECNIKCYCFVDSWNGCENIDCQDKAFL
jgi:hypothetical protein